ncbi:hypothetical protein ACROYT_G030909 [Oculina patagonica]
MDGHRFYAPDYYPQFPYSYSMYSPNSYSPEKYQQAATCSQSESPASCEGNETSPDSEKQPGKKSYDTWSQDQQKLLVQLSFAAENHEFIESKESRNAWRKICEDLNARAKTSRNVDKCMIKMKYLIDKYKAAKEWNRKQTGGSIKKSLFYDEIDTILGCRDIVTVQYVSEAGASTNQPPSFAGSSSNGGESGDSQPSTSQGNSAASSPASSEEKKKEMRRERKKQTKKKKAGPEDEDDDEERIEFSESLKSFRESEEKCDVPESLIKPEKYLLSFGAAS